MVGTTCFPVSKNRATKFRQLASAMRAAEKVLLAFLAYGLIASWLCRLSLEQRLTVSALNLIAAGVLFLLSLFGHPGRSEFLTGLRGWLPCVLIILAYRESGLFLTPDAAHRLDYFFIRWDRMVLESAWFLNLVAAGTPWLQRTMELAYLLTYPFIPLGFGVIYLATRESCGETDTARAVDRFWTSVLLAVLTCYVLFPFFPLTPPRVLFHDLPGPVVEPLLRKMNFWILERYSVQACIFPSGHVAGALATALAVRAHRPRLGVVFLFAAASIAASTVFGRYHYTADALAGALVGAAAYAVSARIHRPQVLPSAADA